MASVREKLVAVGDDDCGKTSLLYFLLTHKFPDSHVFLCGNCIIDVFATTAEQGRLHSLAEKRNADPKCFIARTGITRVFHFLDRCVDPFLNVLVELDLNDTTGNELYDRLRSLSYPNVDVVLICFSIVSPDSLKNIDKKWISEVRHFCPNAPIILVGNKKDLRDDPETIVELANIKQEPVRSEEGRTVAKRIGAFAYVECSAKANDGIDVVVDVAAQAALRPKILNKCVVL